MVKIISAIVLFLTIFICATIANKNQEIEDEKFAFSYVDVDTSTLAYGQRVYVPVNARPKEKKYLNKDLTTVLKIRNTSLTDSLFVFNVHYFDKDGQRLKTFVDSTLLVKPMATKEIFVRNKDFDTTGDNFIVEWRANSITNSPIIQALSSEPGTAFIFKENGVVLENLHQALN